MVREDIYEPYEDILEKVSEAGACAKRPMSRPSSCTGWPSNCKNVGLLADLLCSFLYKDHPLKFAFQPPAKIALGPLLLSQVHCLGLVEPPGAGDPGSRTSCSSEPWGVAVCVFEHPGSECCEPTGEEAPMYLFSLVGLCSSDHAVVSQAVVAGPEHLRTLQLASLVQTAHPLFDELGREGHGKAA